MTGPSTSGRRPRLLPALGVAAVLALTAACAGTPDGAAAGGVDTAPGTLVRAATLLPGQAVPAPTGKVVLTLTGLVSAPNRGASIVLDQGALDRLGLVQVALYEPWIKKEATFQGVWLIDLLEVAGVPAAASTLALTALDDYRIEVPMADVRAGGILVALRTGDGSAIPVADGGPTRIVYLPDVPAGANMDRWIWSLKSIEIR